MFKSLKHLLYIFNRGASLFFAAFTLQACNYSLNSIKVEGVNEDRGILLKEISDEIYGYNENDGHLTAGGKVTLNINTSDTRIKKAISIENMLFTPSGENKYTEDVVITDRAFVSIAFAGYEIRKRWFDLCLLVYCMDILTETNTQIGYAGPSLKAYKTQSFLHKIAGKYDPVGWKNQFQDKAFFSNKSTLYIRNKVKPFIDLITLEAIPHATYMLGDWARYVSVGGTVRIGFGIINDFGPQSFDLLGSSNGNFNGSKKSFSIFAAAERRFIDKNDLITGFGEGNIHPGLKMTNTYDEYQFGLDLKINKISGSIAIVKRGKEYELQEIDDIFVRASMMHYFDKKYVEIDAKKAREINKRAEAMGESQIFEF